MPELTDGYDSGFSPIGFGYNGKIYVVIAHHKWVSKGYYDSYEPVSHSIYYDSGALIHTTETSTEARQRLYYVNGNDKKTYLFLVHYRPDEEEGNNSYESFTVIDVNGAQGSSAQVKVSHANAWPNPLPQGRMFTVQFDNALEADAVMAVVNMSGAVVYRSNIAAGEDKAVVPANALRSGNFVYSITSDGLLIEKGKIIAR